MRPDPVTFESIRARLHLRAVLPALATLVAVDSEARTIAEKLDFALRFKSQSGAQTTIQFQNGTIAIDPKSGSPSPFTLHSPSDKQLNKLFLKEGLPVVFPSWQLWKLPELLRFQKLSDRLEKVLKADLPDLRANSSLLRNHIKLLIEAVIPAAFTQLGRHEPKSKEILSGHGGLIEFRVSGHPIQSWIDLQNTETIEYGSGSPPRSPDFIITFQNLDTALQSTRNELDALAATASGDIALQGKIPLGEAANAVLDRISLYLKI